MAAAASLALVTGASSGIGEVFARRLSARGLDLVLVARRAERLERLAAELRPSGRRVEVIALDLARPGADAALEAEVARRGLEVGWLINNAGFGFHGAAVDLDPARQADMIQLNVGAVAALARRFLPPMLARGAGVVLNVASTAAFQPVPYFAVYAATKAFVRSFSEALAEEVEGRGVRVVCLCPGPTATEFFDRSGLSPKFAGVRMLPAEVVVDAGLRGVDAGRRVVVPGLANALVAHATRFIPGRLVTRAGARIMRPHS
ncbi:MAG TPA: SDR family oxidoreductase [Thermodesulfobacteriota bacterium]